MAEIKQIPNQENYFASSDGFIYSNKSGEMKKLKCGLDNKGYHRVVLSQNGKMYFIRVSRLILLTFVGEPKEGAMALHGEIGKESDALSNLYWGDAKRNMQDKKRDGTHPDGERNGKSKLKESDVREIMSLKGKFSSYKLGDRFGVSKTQILAIWSGKRWSQIFMRADQVIQGGSYPS